MQLRIIALVILTIAVPPTHLTAITPTPDTLRDSEQRQQQIRSRVQVVAQQIDAIIAEFDRNGLGDGEDVRSLRAIRSVLGDLSDREMEQVVAMLRQARSSSNGNASDARRSAGDAYVTQQTILARLRGLFAEFHRQQSLQELAARIAALAARQGLNLKSAVDLARSVGSRAPDEYPESANESLRLQATAQQTLNAEVTEAVEVMRYLSDKADGPAAQRLREAIDAVDSSKLTDVLVDALDDLRGANLYRAATNQKSVRDTLAKIAALLGPQLDALGALRAAADDLDRLIEQQKQLADQTQQARTRADFTAAESKQAQIVSDTDAAREAVEHRSPDAAQAIERALDAMQHARGAMLERKAAPAGQKQATALAELERARAELAERIAQAQAERDKQATNAPTTGPTTRDAQAQTELDQKQRELAELLDKIKALRARQKELADTTTAQQSNKSAVASEAPKQKELAGDARDAQQAAGDREQSESAGHLADAAKDMEQAAEAMAKRDAGAARSEQQDAADALNRAADAVAKAQDQLAQAQRDLEQLQKSREEVAQLIKDQQAINDATAQAAGERSEDQKQQQPPPQPQSDQQAGSKQSEGQQKQDAAKQPNEQSKKPEEGSNPAGQKSEPNKPETSEAQQSESSSQQGKPKEEGAGGQPSKQDLPESGKPKDGPAGGQPQGKPQGGNPKGAGELAKQQAAAAAAAAQAARGAAGGNAPGAESAANNAGAHMGNAGAQLRKQDVSGARPEQKEAMNSLVKAKQTLDDRIQDLKKQLGDSAMDPQNAQDVAKSLGEAMQELQDAQRALRGANEPGNADQAIADGQKHLEQAAKAAAEAAANAEESGVTDATAAALPKMSDAASEASSGNPQEAAARAAEAQASLAEAQAALAVAQAQAGMQPGAKPGQQPGNAKGAFAQQQDEQTGKASDRDAPERGGSGSAEGERAADPNGHGRRNAVTGAGAYQGLPARDRASLQQSQKDKYPEEYGPLIEQYLKSLAEEGK